MESLVPRSAQAFTLAGSGACRCAMTGASVQTVLHCLEGSAHGCDELKGEFFWCTGTRPGGHVHRDMAPRFWCTCLELSTEISLIHTVRTTTTTKGFAQDNRCVALIASPVAVTMLLHGERAKHERMSIAIALAENLHHSLQKVEGNASDGLRAQKYLVVTLVS